jgi:hypothetical protein
VRRDGQLGDQQEDATEETAEPLTSAPAKRGAQPGGRAPVLGMLPENGHR